MTPARYQRLLTILNRRQPDLTVVANQVHKPRNFAAIVRTCDAVGIGHVHRIWAEAESRQFRGTSLGSERWVRTHLHTNFADCHAELKQQGMHIYAAHFSGRAEDFRNLDYTRPCALLLGNEKHGVSDDVAKVADKHLVIPMMGMVQSFNVSVAAAIILSEAQRQRAEAGMYETRRISEEEFSDTLFRWAHPEIARYCNKEGVPFPPLDDSGHIINGAAWMQALRGRQP